MRVRVIISLVATLVFLIVAGCEDGLSEDEAAALIRQELVRKMKAGELDGKRFPVVKINPSSNRVSVNNFPENMKLWFYGVGYVRKGRRMSDEALTAHGLEYLESATT
jgi:hypothetical protein